MDKFMKQIQYIEKMLSNKVISGLTLDKELKNDPEQFKKISDLCVLAETGLDQSQADEALEELSKYTPNRQTAYVSSVEEDGIRKIAWTYLHSKTWQFVIELPAYVRTVRKDGELRCLPVH